jgi:hypothetical protein
MRFPNVQDIREYILRQEKEPANISSENAAETGSAEFNDNMTLDEAMDCLRTGGACQKYIEKIKTIPSPNLKQQPSPRIQRVRSLAGSTPAVPAYIAGATRTMYRNIPEETKQPPRTISVGVDIAVSASVDAEAIINRGAAIIAAIQAVETPLTRIKLEANLYAIDKSERKESIDFCSMSIPLKQYHSKLIPADISFVLCHPAFIRRIYMRVVEVTPDLHPLTEISYGRPATLPKKERDKYDVYLKAIEFRQGHKWLDYQYAADEIMKQFKSVLAQ